MYDYIYSLKIKNSFSKNLTFAMPAAAAKLLQLCLTLCDPKDYSLPGSSAHVIFQARVLEWVAIPFSRVSIPLDPGIEPRSAALQTDSLPSEPPGKSCRYQRVI